MGTTCGIGHHLGTVVLQFGGMRPVPRRETGRSEEGAVRGKRAWEGSQRGLGR